MDSTQRLYYRADNGHSIDVVLVAAGHPPISGSVTDVYMDGVGIVLPSSATLPLGQSVELGMSPKDAAYKVRVSAVVRTRHEEESRRRYGLRFQSNDELRRKVPEGLYSLFNRRRAQRFRLSTPIDVCVTPNNSIRPVNAQITGVSETGLSLVVAQQSEVELASAKRIIMRRDDAPDATLELMVKNRILLDHDGIRYGCAFTTRSPAQQRRATMLVEDLVERERRVQEQA